MIGFATYFPCLRGERIWDDDYLIGDNPFFKSPALTAEMFQRHLFEESFSTYYRPVQNLSYLADYWLWGGGTAGFHCTNVALHAMAAWLLYLLLRRLLPDLWRQDAKLPASAFFIALFWLVHPVHNAAVAYISGRADTLATLFALSAWLLALHARAFSHRAARIGCRLLAAFVFLAALCSKEIALVWALLYGIHALFFERTSRWPHRIYSLAGLMAVVATYALLRGLPEAQLPVPGALPEPLAGRAILALRALGDYCGLMIAPVRLMMERSLGPAEMYASRATWWNSVHFELLSIMGISALIAILWLCLRRGEGRKLRRFGAIWFLVAFIPISNLIPLNAEVAEHWIYTASIGFLMLLAGSVAMLPRKAMPWSAAVALAAVAALAVRTAVRAADWADGETFAKKTIASGGGTPRMLTYYANALGRQGRLAEQVEVYRQMVATYPTYLTARINLGVLLQKQGQTEEARPLLELGKESALAAEVPRTWNAALNTAGQLHKEGRSAEALALIREWKPAHPHTWELAGLEANVLHETEGALASLAVVEKFALAHWWHLPSQLGLASLQREAGDFPLALRTAKNAQRLDICGAAAFAEAARCEASLGRFSEALEAQAIAVARAPGSVEDLRFFSAILHRLGRDEEAKATLRKAEALAAQRPLL